MCCTASSVWARRARSLANSSSEMSSSIVFVRAWRRRRLKRLKTDVDAIWQVLFCLTEHAAEEDEEKCGGRDAPLLDATGDGRGDVSQEFPKSITADSIKGIGQAYESCIYIPMFCSLHFSCICLSTKIMSMVPLLDLNLHWLFGVFSCAIVRMSLFSKTRAKILPDMESRVMLR